MVIFGYGFITVVSYYEIYSLMLPISPCPQTHIKRLQCHMHITIELQSRLVFKWGLTWIPLIDIFRARLGWKSQTLAHRLWGAPKTGCIWKYAFPFQELAHHTIKPRVENNLNAPWPDETFVTCFRVNLHSMQLKTKLDLPRFLSDTNDIMCSLTIH